MITPIILCGGSGTRLWPSSRKSYPKQFAPLIGQESLYQATLRRMSGPGFGQPLVMIAPSDHVIADAPDFLAAIERAREAAETSGALITFGITPDRAETGYGYLELPTAPTGPDATPLTSFREKPDQATAEGFLETGRYLWNAGIFLFKVSDSIAAFETHAADLIAPCRDAVAKGTDDLGLFRLDPAGYDAARKVSFDYAVMEQAETVMAVPFTGGWSDLGSWESIWQAEDPDADGLATHGAATAVECTDTYLRSEEPGVHLVALGWTGSLRLPCAMRFWWRINPAPKTSNKWSQR